ncbi:MAG: HIT family protein [Euryarchaeota archaeon]|nr:HIT family protein [Euryarchaeota archaeon]|tara:strand:- start:374 stop:820 length:447 start_codon:yes stop_codon:yes gene_type:complete
MSESITLFSKIINGDIPCFEISKGDNWLSFLDINPRRTGHTLVVPYEPVSHLAELSSQQLSDLWEGVIETQKLLSKFFNTSDFLVGVHDGTLAGQEIPHVHIHIIPRTKGDGGRSLLACWPKAPTIGSVEPDFSALAKIQKEIQDANT